jgi:hypothetical protein
VFGSESDSRGRKGVVIDMGIVGNRNLGDFLTLLYLKQLVKPQPKINPTPDNAPSVQYLSCLLSLFRLLSSLFSKNFLIHFARCLTNFALLLARLYGDFGVCLAALGRVLHLLLRLLPRGRVSLNFVSDTGISSTQREGVN